LSQIAWKTFDIRIAEATRAGDRLAEATVLPGQSEAYPACLKWLPISSGVRVRK